MINKFTFITFILISFIFYSLAMYEGGWLAGFTEAAAICEVLIP
jgi:hypothetical protein